jgi:hypothetical protein
MIDRSIWRSSTNHHQKFNFLTDCLGMRLLSAGITAQTLKWWMSNPIIKGQHILTRFHRLTIARTVEKAVELYRNYTHEHISCSSGYNDKLKREKMIDEENFRYKSKSIRTSDLDQDHDSVYIRKLNKSSHCGSEGDYEERDKLYWTNETHHNIPYTKIKEKGKNKSYRTGDHKIYPY